MNKRGRRTKFIGIDKEINFLYCKKKLSNLCTFQQFKDWYLIYSCTCHYCGITEVESKTLFFKFPESTRGGKRGRKLELDRKNPNLNYYYTLKNLCFSCYWCNNSKSNYFTENEFKKIGVIIGEINRDRLKKK